jgi:hypothetical protein
MASTFSRNDQEKLDPARCFSVADRPLRNLTLDEKVSMLYGSSDPESLGQAGYVISVPRLGIPELRLNNGPAGVNVARDATCLPSPISMAATFSLKLANQYGTARGRAARTLEQNILPAPQIDVVAVYNHINGSWHSESRVTLIRLLHDGSGQGLTRTTTDGVTMVNATVDFTDPSALPSSKTYYLDRHDNRMHHQRPRPENPEVGAAKEASNWTVWRWLRRPSAEMVSSGRGPVCCQRRMVWTTVR